MDGIGDSMGWSAEGLKRMSTNNGPIPFSDTLPELPDCAEAKVNDDAMRKQSQREGIKGSIASERLRRKKAQDKT